MAFSVFPSLRNLLPSSFRAAARTAGEISSCIFSMQFVFGRQIYSFFGQLFLSAQEEEKNEEPRKVQEARPRENRSLTRQAQKEEDWNQTR
mmetsp:Transcript_43315/g.85486  ORF Transcript_43315/g.85486 Transcript_43315/m.85486 type:complete len:91 (+) Transcript_43315:1517-1789(+)